MGQVVREELLSHALLLHFEDFQIESAGELQEEVVAGVLLLCDSQYRLVVEKVSLVLLAAV